MSTASRVARGVRYLDKHEPGWAEKVTRPINLYSSTDCILGQVGGDYHDYLDMKYVILSFFPLWQDLVGSRWAFLHGFNGNGSARPDLATDLWQQAVADRQVTAMLRDLATKAECEAEWRCQQAAARIREFEATYRGSPLRREGASERMSMTIEERVLNGAARLDERVPGWDAQIDLNILDVESTMRCVVGQTFGDYDLGLGILNIPSPKGHSYGFSLSESTALAGTESYAQLTEAWLTLIEARRVATRVADRESVAV